MTMDLECLNGSNPFVKRSERGNTPRVLSVRAKEMAEAGHVFFPSNDGVWLTRAVPPEFLEWPNSIGQEK